MNDKRYRDLALILAVVAMIISDSPFAPEIFPNEGIWNEVGYFSAWGWIPGLALAIVSFIMTWRMQRRDKILVRSFSSLAIILSLLWAIPVFRILMHTSR